MWKPTINNQLTTITTTNDDDNQKIADSNVELVNIECNSNNILVTLNSHNFNGMIYPKGLSKNSSCMVEYNSVDSVTYVLPLRSCNTMSADVVSFVGPLEKTIFHSLSDLSPGLILPVKCSPQSLKSFNFLPYLAQLCVLNHKQILL